MKKRLILCSVILLISTLTLFTSCDWLFPDDPNDPDNPDVTDTTAPANVTGLTAESCAGGVVVLSWTEPGDTDFAGVDITWDNGGTDVQKVAASASETQTYTTAGLTDGTTYTFTVKSRDVTGNVSTGATVTATADASAPANGTAADTVVTVDETNVTIQIFSPNDPDFAGCKVTWTAGGTYHSFVQEGSPRTTAEIDPYVFTNFQTSEGLEEETTYTFTIQYYDVAGNLNDGFTVDVTTSWIPETIFYDDFTAAAVTDPGYATFVYSGDSITYPTYASTDAPISTLVDYAEWSGSDNYSVLIPSGVILCIGAVSAVTPTTSSSTPGGAFDLSERYKVEVGLWTDSDPTTGSVEIYLDNNTDAAFSSIHGTESLIASASAVGIDYWSDNNYMAYVLSVKNDTVPGNSSETGSMYAYSIFHPNVSDGTNPVGTSTSFIMIYNNTNGEIGLDYIRISH